MKNPKNYSSVSIIVVAVILIIISLASWYVWQKQSSDINKQNGTAKTSKQTKQPTPPIELIASKLPKGWKATMNLDGAVAVTNPKTACSTIMKYTTDTTVTDPAKADSTQALVDSLRAKKNTVTQTAVQLPVLTANGEKKVDATRLQVVGPNASEQDFAAVARKDFYVEIQLSCPQAKDLPTAQAALLAIRLNKQL
ncbi:MAG TPA: hypothetical protein VFL85_01380 [Candidatus Saccharimonadales bacterium]|nr:hypothetical protein [Candidatus Saccharimonadales bacterium]